MGGIFLYVTLQDRRQICVIVSYLPYTHIQTLLYRKFTVLRCYSQGTTEINSISCMCVLLPLHNYCTLWEFHWHKSLMRLSPDPSQFFYVESCNALTSPDFLWWNHATPDHRYLLSMARLIIFMIIFTCVNFTSLKLAYSIHVHRV